LKVLVKHVLAIVILIPLSVLALSAWLIGGDPIAKLFTLFPLLLVSVLFIEPLNKQSVLRFRGVANLLGGALPLASLYLPYLFVGSSPWFPLESGAVSFGVPQLIVVGSILTFFSRFGVLVTIAGLWDGSSIPIFCPAFGCPPLTFGPGYWLGWAGATVSLLGRSWMPLPKSAENQKLVGATLFSAGVIVAIFAGLFTSSWFYYFGGSFLLGTIFIASGFLISGVGLIMFLGLQSTTIARIRRALQKPLV